MTASGDDRYRRRAELVGPDAAPLAVAAGEVIFGDPDTRFGELTGLPPDTAWPAAALSAQPSTVWNSTR